MASTNDNSPFWIYGSILWLAQKHWLPVYYEPVILFKCVSWPASPWFCLTMVLLGYSLQQSTRGDVKQYLSTLLRHVITQKVAQYGIFWKTGNFNLFEQKIERVWLWWQTRAPSGKSRDRDRTNPTAVTSQLLSDVQLVRTGFFKSVIYSRWSLQYSFSLGLY